MRKFTQLLLSLALAFIVVGGAKSAEYEIFERKTSVAEGDVIAIVNEGEEKAFFGSGGNGLGYAVYSTAFKSSNATICFKLEATVGGFLLRAMTPGGKEYSIYGGPGYLNSQAAEEGKWCCFIQGLKGQNGEDIENGAVWDIQYSDGNGFSIKNVGTGKYLKDASPAKYENETYFSLCTLKEKTKTAAASTTLFPLDSYNNGWTFETPADFSDWSYLVITTENTAADASHEITITDNYSTSVHGEGYEGGSEGAKTGGKMWLDRWNNQNAIRISLDYLKNVKGLDITRVKSLTFTTGVTPAVIYLTNYNNTKINGGYCQGDVVRTYTTTGKFGTICLPYVASYAGAEIYKIAGSTDNSVTLSKVTGLLEAGKPYFYVSSDVNGQNNEGNVHNVNFFQADLATYNAATAGSNNGLIGTFTNTTAPIGTNYYVLSSNKLYQVDSEVTVGANKAYVDWSQITNTSAAPALSLDVVGGDATGINSLTPTPSPMSEGSIYDLSGRRVVNPTKGVYVVNGKKVVIK